MVKKIMTGLALSVGAGVAVAVTGRAVSKEGWPWRAAKNSGSMTPVTIRVHKAIPRTEALSEHLPAETEMGGARPQANSPETTLELAEIRVMVEALEQRSTEMLGQVNQRIDDLQNHLPRFIDVKVTSRLRETEERLRSEFQEEQSKSLDAFLQTLDQKVLPRLSLVEEAVGAQGAEIGMMRQRIEKTDESLDRVLKRVEEAVDAMVYHSDTAPSAHVMEIHHKKAVA